MVGHEILNFFGVYLLYCKNEQFHGHTYIGFTVDPNRRVSQHNKGAKAGGAKRTDGRGPWDMVLIVHGFPSKISALRFEWAWQHPHKSRRLKSFSGKSKTKKEVAYEHRLRVLCMLLSTGPWNRLPLTVRWLKQEYIKEFPATSAPPVHMAIAYGPVKAVQKVPLAKDLQLDSQISQHETCDLCLERLNKANETSLRCYCEGCSMVSHMICLARHFLKNEQHYLVPVEGSCPVGNHSLLWGHLIAFRHGVLPNKIPADADFG